MLLYIPLHTKNSNYNLAENEFNYWQVLNCNSVMKECHMHILIVEDEFAVGEMIKQNIENWGHTADIASNGKETLEKFSENNFKLILLDIFLPDIGGHKLIPHFKKTSPDIGIVTMTGENSRELEKEVRLQGILYYMTKPFESKSLKALIDHVEKKELSK